MKKASYRSGQRDGSSSPYPTDRLCGEIGIGLSTLWLITESGKRAHDNLMWAKDSGFRSIESFLAHHAQNPQSVKYAITYRVVDMKGDGE
jgi:hypothetical protein